MDSNSPSATDFLKQMHDLQQMYFRNMEQVFSSTNSEKDSSKPFEQWWQQMSSMSKPGVGNMAGSPGMDIPAQDWLKNMTSQFQQWSDSSRASNPLFNHINEQFKQQLMMPWGAKLFNAASEPSDFLEISQFINSPIINLLQQLFNQDERQSGQQLLGSLEQYQQLMMQYNHLMAGVGIDSLKSIQESLNHSDNVDFEELSRQWLEISQQLMQQEKYQAPAKDLDHKLKQLKTQLNSDYEQYRATLIKQLGLATSKEVADLRKQVDQLKQKLK